MTDATATLTSATLSSTTPTTKRAAIRPRRSEEERVFRKDTHWFFRTREGEPKGPFIDKQHAYWGLAKYIRQQCSFR